MSVRPKKALGQHFLKDDQISQNIANAMLFKDGVRNVIEVGPGTGALTKFLIQKDANLKVVEVDRESVDYLNVHYHALHGKIIEQSFLKLKLDEVFGDKLIVIGNFPYNISSQILFHALDHKEHVTEVIGMFQKEVAERIAIGPGSKAYGILSVLLQAYYDIEYLFTVDEDAFNPPPKVKSGVIRLVRNDVQSLDCDEKRFKQVIKLGFNQRRKTLRNSLKSILGDKVLPEKFQSERPEQLSVQDFVELTNFIYPREDS
ncbi:MAG: 16S rRNA (adenine(1518)-N(6)/adenine(1519)-N(6))-dimethyltransferase RsmA [Flavobacteriales bacterium]